MNFNKCKLIAKKNATNSGVVSNFEPADPDSVMLIGGHLGTGHAMDDTWILTLRNEELYRGVERSKLVSAHDACTSPVTVVPQRYHLAVYITCSSL